MPNIDLNKLPMERNCFLSHMGEWMIESKYMQNLIGWLESGRFRAQTDGEGGGRAQMDIQQGVAIIDISGALSKGSSKAGTSTMSVRRLIRAALRDEDVEVIMLSIDSPGGQVAGTKELADEIAQANTQKPIIAQIDDLGASAALWIASQAGNVFANATAEVGSIGTVAVVTDLSQKAEMEGVKVHVISTGEFKGAFAPGSEVTDAQIENLQSRINSLNEFFLSAISTGRRMPREAVEKIADGRVFMASEAAELGLIDAIQSFGQTFEFARAMAKDISSQRMSSASAPNLRKASALIDLEKQS